MTADSLESMAARLDRVESHLAIQQLPPRYALALDSRDLDTMVGLFVDDVNAGQQWGTGREALKRFFTTNLSHFYRSMHLIAGHTINFDDADHAHGVVHCRAEHESGKDWGIMVMNYKDDYERHEGQWYFRRRRLQPLYSCDILQRPHGPNFNRGWGVGSASEHNDQNWGALLPFEYPTFAAFWAQFPPGHVEALTVEPVPSAPTR